MVLPVWVEAPDSVKRLAHQGWFMVQDGPHAERLDSAPAKVVKDNWKGLYLNGECRDSTGCPEVRECKAEVGAHCMYGVDARKAWRETELDQVNPRQANFVARPASPRRDPEL